MADGAWAPEGRAGGQVWPGQGARRLQRWETRDEGLRMTRTRPLSPAPSIPLPGKTSRTAGLVGSFLWGA